MKNKINLGFYKTHPDAFIPQFATEGSAAFDLKACLTPDSKIKGFSSDNTPIDITVFSDGYGHDIYVELFPEERIILPTGLIIDIPVGYSVRVHPRSGTALKSGVILVNSEGVVDWDYVEEAKILLVNTSKVPFIIAHGDRVAQAELVETLSVGCVEVKERPVQKTTRSGGFGSTGTK